MKFEGPYLLVDTRPPHKVERQRLILWAVGSLLAHPSEQLLHRFVERATRTRSPRMSDPLDIIKYLCKDLWSALFRKKVGYCY